MYLTLIVLSWLGLFVYYEIQIVFALRDQIVFCFPIEKGILQKTWPRLHNCFYSKICNFAIN